MTAGASRGTVLSALATARVAQVASEAGEIPALSRNGDAPFEGMSPDACPVPAKPVLGARAVRWMPSQVSQRAHLVRRTDGGLHVAEVLGRVVPAVVMMFTANGQLSRGAGSGNSPSGQPVTAANEAAEQGEMPEPGGSTSRAGSRVLVNTGHGKGKSSAAFGVMGRAWARGWRVGVIQFVKGGRWQTGERKLAAHLGVEWHTLGDGFTWESTDLDETAAKNRHAWQVARSKLASGDYDLLILDELTYVVSYDWVPVAEVVAGIAARAANTNVVITGRDAAPELVELADTVTEMRKVKHAYDEGVRARKGIEY